MRKHPRGTEFRAIHKVESIPKIVLVPSSERNKLVPNCLRAYSGTAVPGTWLLGDGGGTGGPRASATLSDISRGVLHIPALPA